MTVPPKGANENRSDCQELELTSKVHGVRRQPVATAREFNKDYGFYVTPRCRPEVT